MVQSFPEMYKKEQSFSELTGTVLPGGKVKARSWVSGGTPTIRTLTTAQTTHVLARFRPGSLDPGLFPHATNLLEKMLDLSFFDQT